MTPAPAGDRIQTFPKETRGVEEPCRPQSANGASPTPTEFARAFVLGYSLLLYPGKAALSLPWPSAVWRVGTGSGFALLWPLPGLFILLGV